MTKIAFLGLGMMGTPMATRLIEAGHDLTVWDRTDQKTKALVDRGAMAADSPAEAAVGVEVAITMLANPQALERVVFEGGLARALGRGQVLMDMSTVGPDEIRSLRERVPEGVIVVDAPVRGSVPEAIGGKLDIFVGATDEGFERVREVLVPLGTVHHVGGPGAVRRSEDGHERGLGCRDRGRRGGAVARRDLRARSQRGPRRPRRFPGRSRPPRPSGPTSNPTATRPVSSWSLALKDMQLVTEAAIAAGRDLKLAEASRAWLDEAAGSRSGRPRLLGRRGDDPRAPRPSVSLLSGGRTLSFSLSTMEGER